MTEQLGRRDDAGVWMRAVPVGTMAAMLAAGLTFYAASQYRVHQLWTPTQQAAVKTYIRSTFGAEMGSRGRYTPLPGRPAPTHADVERYLREAVYEGRTLLELARAPLLAAALVLIVGLVFGVSHDARAARERRHGRRLKGAELVTAEQFNVRMAGDGIGVLQEGWPTIRIPRELEGHHVLVTGDSGSGKSTIIRQLLVQIRARGETAVVYDPAGEYLQQFYDPAGGDQVLNPLDARCPYWSPADEVQVNAEALSLATSLFPTRPNENPFFTEGPRRIFAYLLTLRPTADVLGRWLSDGDELDRLLKGTPHAHFIAPDAPQQRAGVLASLNMQADTLALLPLAGETSQRWSAAAWAKRRQGWLFFTSSPETRERQIPLMTLWLDLLILRLMQNKGGPKTWMLIDELASLRKLPQLPTALTENRKANTPLVLGFQARSQMEAIYGPSAEAMLSQPATKIILRTSEANSAKWLSATVGDVEIERFRQSRSQGQRLSTSYALERSVEPLLLPSEIEGLADRTGYLKVGNIVTPIRFPYLSLPSVAEGFVPRPALPGTPAGLPPGYHVVPRPTDGGRENAQMID